MFFKQLFMNKSQIRYSLLQYNIYKKKLKTWITYI